MYNHLALLHLALTFSIPYLHNVKRAKVSQRTNRLPTIAENQPKSDCIYTARLIWKQTEFRLLLQINRKYGKYNLISIGSEIIRFIATIAVQHPREWRLSGTSDPNQGPP